MSLEAIKTWVEGGRDLRTVRAFYTDGNNLYFEEVHIGRTIETDTETLKMIFYNKRETYERILQECLDVLEGASRGKAYKLEGGTPVDLAFTKKITFDSGGVFEWVPAGYSLKTIGSSPQPDIKRGE